jgi:single-strand DNA-binding protein
MASLNEVKLIGRLGQDVEVRQTSNSEVANVTLATTDYWTDKSGAKQEETQWHRLEAWGPLAAVLADFTKKGSQVYIGGSLRYGKFTDKEGVERYTTTIRVDNVQLLDKKPQA